MNGDPLQNRCPMGPSREAEPEAGRPTARCVSPLGGHKLRPGEPMERRIHLDMVLLRRVSTQPHPRTSSGGAP
jgi:hypothetical protein